MTDPHAVSRHETARARAWLTAAAIAERRPDALPEVKAAVARNLAAELGDTPLRCPVRAFVFAARKPRGNVDRSSPLSR